ncbi:MAG: NADPH-dependent reductase [Chlorobi bacterium]|nr:NADPH-dependent reductase [Chlorobiota bacterium]
MNILAFAASLRSGSYNRKLLMIAVEMARDAGATVDLAEFREFDMPLFDGDLHETIGMPEGGREMISRIEKADGIMIASPEYNYSIPGTLKNAIDWVSRARPMPLRGKSGLIMAASGSAIGGIRGLWQLRIPLEGLGVYLHPDMFALPSAPGAFDDEGKLKDEAMAKRLRDNVISYVTMGTRLAEPVKASLK